MHQSKAGAYMMVSMLHWLSAKRSNKDNVSGHNQLHALTGLRAGECSARRPTCSQKTVSLTEEVGSGQTNKPGRVSKKSPATMVSSEADSQSMSSKTGTAPDKALALVSPHPLSCQQMRRWTRGMQSQPPQESQISQLNLACQLKGSRTRV